MDDAKLQEIFKRAAELSKSVPEHLREAAFNRAVDALLASEQIGGISTKHSSSKSILNKKPHDATPRHGASLDDLDRTAYPQIIDARTALDRSLHILRIAKDDFGVDGLGPTAIAKILTDKFRLKTTKQSVSEALDKARHLVDRVTAPGKHAYFRIMLPGEQYLDSGASSKGMPGPVPKSSSRKTTRKISKSTDDSEKHASSVQKKNPKKQNARGTKGPKAVLLELVQEGFFDQKRRVSDIASHLKQKKGYTIKVTPIAVALIRMLRDNTLERDRAEDGQYEYQRK